MSAKDANTLVIGGEPRIDFLPPEVKQRKQARRTIRSLIALVVVVMVACAGGYVFATSLALQSQTALADEQAKTTDLLNQQGQYAEARTVAAQLAATQDARLVALANEILWKAQLAELRATLPSGMEIVTVAVDSTSATEVFPIPSVPLETERVATLQLTATASTLPATAAWLDNLRDLRGFADVWATPALWDGEQYEVDVRLNINADAFEKRFFENADAAADAPEPEGTPSPETGETPAPEETGNEG